MTDLLYMEDFTVLECDATITQIQHEDGRTLLILDKTCFYPQGGGQPYDQGMIESPTGSFIVEEVRKHDDEVMHIGRLEEGALSPGTMVKCRVDKHRRHLHNKLHSGGHVLDYAVKNIGLDWQPGKGYHFPDGPYVEYQGSYEEIEKEKIMQHLENECNRIIRQGAVTTTRSVSLEEASTICAHMFEFPAVVNMVRIVCFDEFCLPCGGTHVKNLSDIGRFSIRNMKQKQGFIRIGYDVQR